MTSVWSENTSQSLNQELSSDFPDWYPLGRVRTFYIPMGCQGSFSSLSNLICSDNFLTHVGAPTMQYYDDHAWLYDGDLDGPQSSTAFIFIPFVHPGRDKYGKQPEALRRVFLLSWMVALTLGSFMMDALENVSDEEEFQGREHICRAVIA